MSNCPVTYDHLLRTLDTDPPRWPPVDGKALLDPRFIPEYTRTPHLAGMGAHSFIRFMKEIASPQFQDYVRSCLQWAQDNPGVWRPAWIDAVRQQIRLERDGGRQQQPT